MDRRKPEPKKREIFERGNTRVPEFIESWSPTRFFIVFGVLLLAIAGLSWSVSPWLAIFALPVLPLAIIGTRDVFQTKSSILRNFPLLGHLRFIAESVRPEIRQYFVESNAEENPLSREKRTIVYQRAKALPDTLPFGTHQSVYEVGYEWIGHSLVPTHPDEETARVLIGADRCAQPYSASRFNISAMSFGSLSAPAVRSMSEGARRGNFYQNTGEGGVSVHHLEGGGDLVWQIGTGYFGCRAPDGSFDRERFVKTVSAPSIKMIEVKLSQGAKPSHGGILPGKKVTLEIAQARGVVVGETVLSPPAHSAFRTPRALVQFVSELRELSGGRPVGFKLCIGNPVEFMAIVKAMVELETVADFITVDGSEGGTGAAPLEFSNSVGMPLTDGLVFVDNCLRGAGLRRDIKVISAGKITTGFDIVRQLALGADLCNSARAMMLAVGCIQALKCNTNTCPTGVATQDPRLTRGLVVEDKAQRVASYHKETIESLLELLGAAGLHDPDDLRPEHLFRRTSVSTVRSLGEIYPAVREGALLHGGAIPPYQEIWDLAQADAFSPRETARRFASIAPPAG